MIFSLLFTLLVLLSLANNFSLLQTKIYLTKKTNKNFTFFFLSFLCFLKFDISKMDAYCSCICAFYALISYPTELSNYFICYKDMFLHFLHVRSYALVVLLANWYSDILH